MSSEYDPSSIIPNKIAEINNKTAESGITAANLLRLQEERLTALRESIKGIVAFVVDKADELHLKPSEIGITSDTRKGSVFKGYRYLDHTVGTLRGFLLGGLVAQSHFTEGFSDIRTNLGLFVSDDGKDTYVLNWVTKGHYIGLTPHPHQVRSDDIRHRPLNTAIEIYVDEALHSHQAQGVGNVQATHDFIRANMEDSAAHLFKDIWPTSSE